MNTGLPADDAVFGWTSYIQLPKFEDVQALFVVLSSRDKARRLLALESLNKQALTLTGCFKHGNVADGMSERGVVKSTDHDVSEENQYLFRVQPQMLNYLLTSFLRLSMWCPFEDVRLGCKNSLFNFKQQGVAVPDLLVREPSSFIPHEQIPPVDTDDEQTYSLYVESYAQTCRLEHMVLVMGMHPQYLKEFLSVNMHLLKSDGALPHCYRSYIGILAAARHKCQYLVHLMETDFLLSGGDPEWLQGLEHACPKLQSLATLNKLLAHRPWLVKPKHVHDLCSGGAGWQWSQSELLQAIVLLCHFHGLAIFCHGTGINLEIDHIQPADVTNSAIFHHSSNPMQYRKNTVESSADHETDGLYSENDIEVLVQRMKKLHEENDEEVTREEMNRRFENQKNEAANQIFPGGSSETSFLKDSIVYSMKYIDEPDFNYQDFAKRNDSNDIPTFRAMDFNWQDHAYSLISNYYDPMGDMLDLKFNTAYHLTYNTLATKEHVDTSKLRRAIWMYIHCTCGIMFDDYNYGEVNQLLERSLKLFIKTVSCFPEFTTKAVYDAFWKQFRHSEKVHVNIVLLEGRFQVELLYALRAFTQYIK